MEKIDLIDNSGNLTGETRDRKSVHKYGLLHHASGVIVVSESIGGATRFYLNRGHLKRRRMQGFGICPQVDMLNLVRLQYLLCFVR